MALETDRQVSTSGLTDAEAREFQRIFQQSFLIFVGVAVVAHILVYMWRPWLPGPGGYKDSLIEHAGTVLAMLT